MSITESRILLPLLDNAGKSLAHVHKALQLDLMQSFGGFSASPISGVWLDKETGKEYRDESTAYDIAADWNAAAYDGADFSNADRLLDLARWHCRAANQVCLYLRNGKGVVQYVDPLPARASVRGAA